MNEGQVQNQSLSTLLAPHLRSRGIVTAKDLFSRTVLDLVELLDVPFHVVEALRKEVAATAVRSPITAYDLLQTKRVETAHLRTTLPPLDEALRGGLPAGSVTEIVGHSSVGKSQFCFLACVVACLDRMSSNGKVMYIDTEGKFRTERLKQVAVARFPDSFPNEEVAMSLAKHVLLENPRSSDDLNRVLQNLEAAIGPQNINLIIVDSIASLARGFQQAGGAVIERQRLLGQQASRLKYLAEAFSIPVLVTNQVTADVSGKGHTAALGPLWAHAVNTRLVLESRKDSRGRDIRSMHVAKSPLSPNIGFAYEITAAGPVWRQDVEVPPMLPGSVLDMVLADERLHSTV